MLAVGAAAAVGLHRLERQVMAQEVFQQPPILRLVGAPSGIQEEIERMLEPMTARAWSDPDLCRDIGHLLESNGWVAWVKAVRKYPDRRIEIRCEYRRPLVLVAGRGAYYLVSEDRVRLPGEYRYEPGLMLVEGVAGAVPEVGQVWDAPELAAAIGMVRRLQGEPYHTQITSVLVYNYRGRVDSEAAHIRLATDRAGSIILWGSAPGEEMEENSAAEKIAILRENYRRFGRADANRPTIDISVFPDRFSTPG